MRILLGSLDVAGRWFTQQMPRVTPSGDATDALPPLAQLQLLSTNSTSILAVWTLPDSGASSSHVDVVGFKLTYRMRSEEHQFRLMFDLQDRSYLAINLRADALYDFQLFPVLDEDHVETLPSSKSIRTLDEEPEAEAAAVIPGQLDGRALDCSRLELSWMAPPQASPEAAYYTVRYVGEALPAMRIRTTDVSAEVAELVAFTTYRLSVRFHDASDGRSSGYSPSVSIRTLPDVPSAPRDVSWMLDGGAVWLKWSPPLRPNGVVLGYVIRISTEETPPEGLWTEQEEAAGRLATHLRGLLTNHVYYIRIQVSCIRTNSLQFNSFQFNSFLFNSYQFNYRILLNIIKYFIMNASALIHFNRF